MTDREREALQLALDASAKAAAMSDLSATVADMTGELKVVSEAMSEDKVWRRRFVVALCVIGSSIVLNLFSSALLTWVAFENRDNGEVVRDTVDPGGERYERIQRDQGAVIDRLVTDDELDATAQQITDCLLGRGPCPGDS